MTTKKVNYSFEKWDAIELEKWVNSLDSINSSSKNKIIEVIKEESYEGSDILFCTVKDIKEEFGLSPIQSKKFFTSIEVFLQKRKQEISDIAFKAQQKKIEINEEQLDLLINIFEGLFPSMDEKKSNLDKDELKENYANSMKDFQETITQIGYATAAFLKHLIRIKIKKTIKQKLVEICYEYFDLIRVTQTILRKYRATLNNLECVLSEIRDIFMYPVTIMEDLQYLDTETQKKVLNKLKNDTSDNLRKNLLNYDVILKKIDTMIMPKVKKLKNNWNMFGKVIVNVLTLVTANINETEKKISSDDKGKIQTALNAMKGIAKIFGGTIIANKYGKQLRVDGWRDLAVVIQENITLLEKKNNLSQINAMQLSLGFMNKFAVEMSVVLDIISDNFESMKININNPYQQISFTNQMVINASTKSKIVRLGKSILVSIEYLNKSKKHINDVELVCEQQLSQYSDKIHEPLIKMLTAYGK